MWVGFVVRKKVWWKKLLLFLFGFEMKWNWLQYGFRERTSCAEKWVVGWPTSNQQMISYGGFKILRIQCDVSMYHAPMQWDMTYERLWIGCCGEKAYIPLIGGLFALRSINKKQCIKYVLWNKDNQWNICSLSTVSNPEPPIVIFHCIGSWYIDPSHWIRNILNPP